ncbi:hypothetical protein FQ087_18390 [Sporosarcina sp. ANT_H38]|uniref:hypothetical protein n=1 Tax=Sporosarcina sp. ANT_H38 TaxID=2597358 RepID=UPI0011F3C489|nr:hypothetical protein [Sporosarcina sp. ANT_H38]KAA0944096.1 hypothetical protein FQ087_18390 [Sporosarcina sp. ANT_H38]
MIAVVQQLTIFDALPKKAAFVVGDTVEIVVNVEEKEVEDYYYLQDFVGLKGRVVKMIPGLQYEVQFKKKDRIGILRHEELKRSEWDE